MNVITCRIEDAGAEDSYNAFRDALCGGHARRYAMLYRGGDGVRCKLENSGRCLDPDTPWKMLRFMIDPLFRFDDKTEWVALFPVENWKQRCDAALQASLENGRPWGHILADTLAEEMAALPRLVIIR